MEKKNNLIKVCDLCGEKATCLCFQFKLYFCDRCHKFIHDFKINSQHKKESIDYFIPIDLKCPEHNKVPLNLFCIDEKGILYIFIFL